MKKNSISIIKRTMIYVSIFTICILAGCSLGHIAKDTIGDATTILTLFSLTFPTLLIASQGILYENLLSKEAKNPLMKIMATLIFLIGIIVALGIAADSNLSIIPKLLLELATSSIISYDIVSALDISRGEIPKLTSFLPSSFTKLFTKNNKIADEDKSDEFEKIEEPSDADQNRIKLLKTDLNQFIDYCPDIKPQLTRAKSDIAELQKIRLSLDKLKTKAYKVAILEQLEHVYASVKDGILQNIEDIVTICVAGQADFNGKLKENEIEDIELELKDNQYKLDKMKEILSIVGRSATQRTTDMSNIDIDATVDAISSFLDNNSPVLDTK